MKQLYILILSLFIFSCKSDKATNQAKPTATPTVEDGGKLITLPNDPTQLKFFATEKATLENISAQYKAPASVAVSIISSSEKEGRNIVLFDDPDLNAAYSQFLQHLINISQYKTNLDRVKDLAQHGAATGKEVLEAETQLANEEAAITEHEGKLKLAGLDVVKLKDPRNKSAWLICEVPESQINQVKQGTPCSISYTAFGDQTFNANVDGIGGEVDNVTRMIKVRIIMPNPSNQFEVGMFANVSFTLHESNSISVSTSAIVNVQGKDYAFVKTSPTTFERREILAGQQLGDRTVVVHGLAQNEEVVVSSTMQMKGLSFGY